MSTTIQKWGNSLGVRLPIGIATKLSLKNGSAVKMVTKDDSIVITKVEPELSLKEMLKGMTKKNFHKEVDWGRPMGREVW